MLSSLWKQSGIRFFGGYFDGILGARDSKPKSIRVQVVLQSTGSHATSELRNRFSIRFLLMSYSGEQKSLFVFIYDKLHILLGVHGPWENTRREGASRKIKPTASDRGERTCGDWFSKHIHGDWSWLEFLDFALRWEIHPI